MSTTAITNTTAWITDILDRDDAGLLSASPAARQRVTLQDCIARGAVRCLVFLSERHGWAAEDWPRVISAAFGPPAYHSISTAACAVAAAGGHLSMLKLLRERECAWDDETCTRAAARGRLECLQFALDQGCPCNIDACALAAVGERGNIDCLRLLLDRFPLGKAAPVPAAQQRAVCAAAAAEGRVACLQLLHARGWEWDATACASAALGGFTCCLDYLLTQQCPCDKTAAEHAAMAGTMACLVLVGERGAPLSIAAAEAAARNGNVDCLQYLLFRMSEEMRRTCSAPCALAAAEGGSVECLGLLLAALQEDKGSSSASEWNWAVMERRANPHSSAKAWIATVRAAAAAAASV